MAQRWTHARREQIARDLGFTSAYERRQANAFAKQSRDFHRIVGEPNVSDKQDAKMVRLYYQAFRKGDVDDYTLRTRRGRPVVGKDGKGAKAKWLIDVAQYVNDGDEWRRRYPNGARDDAWLAVSME